MKREECIKFIIKQLSQLKKETESSNKLNLTDVNIFQEDLFKEILNIIYKYNLINLNSIEKNASVIDLSDEEKGIGIQVTSNKGRKKIQETINGFINNGLEKKYKRLVVLILTNKTKFKNEFDTKGKFLFSIKDDIWDIDDILYKIQNIDSNTLEKVYDFIASEFGNEQYKKNTQYVDKITENIDSQYISRRIIPVEKYQEVLWKLDKGIDISNVFSIDKHIIMLSDAGNGKSVAAKMLSNYINAHFQKYFSFYYRLNSYTNQKIEELIPHQYKGISCENIVIILDGFDEIIRNSVSTFICNVEFFIRKNPECKVIITTRKNFYRRKSEYFSGTIEGFSEVLLYPISEKDINEYLNLVQINHIEFWNEVYLNRLYDLLKSPFYLSIAIRLFKEDGSLPPRNGLIKEIIEKSLQIDENKYKNIELVNDAKDKILKLLKIIGLSLECIGKNFLTDNEYRELIVDEQRELVKYCSLWYKNEKDQWGFEHNNFAEFLVAEFLSNCPLNVIQDLVTYRNNTDKIKENWINTISFLLSIYHREDLIEWIIHINPKLIGYCERNRIPNKEREKLFKSVFEKYELKKIWFDDNIAITKFAESIEIINFLIEKIIRNEHFTIVGNALLVLMNFEELYGKEETIEKVMMSVCLSNKYRNYEKYYALKLIGKFNLGSSAKLKKIIEFNRENENNYLRAGYFSLCNECNIVDENIEIFLSSYYKVNNRSSINFGEDVQETTLVDEILEFDRGFSRITKYDTLKRIIDFIKEIKTIYDYNEIIKNVCESITNLICTDERVNELVYDIFLFFARHYRTNYLQILNTYFDKWNIRKTIFFRCLKKSEYVVGDSYYCITDDKCLEYFIEAYKNGEYDDSIALNLISSVPNNLKSYEELVKLYEEKNAPIIQKNNNMNSKEIKKKRIKNFSECLFDKEKFKEVILEFFRESNKSYLLRDETIQMHNQLLEGRGILYHIKNVLLYQEEKGIIEFDKVVNNWEVIVLSQTYNLLISADKDFLDIKEFTENVIKDICYKFLDKVNFRDAINYEKNSNKMNYNLCLYLCFFRDCFNWIYPEKIMLDMLEFDYYKNGKLVGIEYIEKILPNDKVKNRITDNLQNRNIRGFIYENHLKYCIRNNITNFTNNAGKILLDKTKDHIERRIAAEYLIFYIKVEEIIGKYLEHLEDDLYWYVLNNIYEKHADEILDYLILCMNKASLEKDGLQYSKYLIMSGRVEGLEYYYNWMKIHNSPFKGDAINNNINEAVSMVETSNCIDILIKIIELVNEKEFNDSSFYGVERNAHKALVNIGSKNNDDLKNIKSKLKKLINARADLECIGFCYYIIYDMENKYYSSIEKECTIDEVKDIVFKLNTTLFKRKNYNWI